MFLFFVFFVYFVFVLVKPHRIIDPFFDLRRTEHVAFAVLRPVNELLQRQRRGQHGQTYDNYNY